MPEAALYPAVKGFLAKLGYDIKGEICGCDVVGVKPGQPDRVVITELKLGFTFELLLQGVDRLACADDVWLAVRASQRGRDRDPRVRKLCRLLGFGLLAIGGNGNVSVLAEPAPYRPRTNLRRRKAVLTEHQRRRGDPSRGGTRGVPIMTSYRQEALACAARLQAGPQRPRDLKQAVPRAASILARNVYDWFERVDRGLYGLTPTGAAALVLYGAAVRHEMPLGVTRVARQLGWPVRDTKVVRSRRIERMAWVTLRDKRGVATKVTPSDGC